MWAQIHSYWEIYVLFKLSWSYYLLYQWFCCAWGLENKINQGVCKLMTPTVPVMIHNRKDSEPKVNWPAPTGCRSILILGDSNTRLMTSIPSNFADAGVFTIILCCFTVSETYNYFLLFYILVYNNVQCVKCLNLFFLTEY